jgi:ATP-dependent helicase/DNAse subunit B
MPSIHYLAGWNVDTRQKLLDEKLSSWTGGPVLHLVPTRGRVIELESDHRFWPKKRQDTLTGLIYRIFEENIRFRQFRDCRQIDDQIRSLAVRKAMEQRSGQPEGLAYFDRLLKDHDAGFPGIFKAISVFFSQLVQNNYQDRFVNDLAGRIIRFEEKGSISGEERYSLESDLAWIFGDFEEIKKQIHAYDADDVLSSVRDFLSRGVIPCPVHEADVVIFDGFIHLSGIEEDILYYIFRRVKEVWWPIDCDGGADEPVKYFMESSRRGKEAHVGMEAYRIFSPMTSFMERLEAEGFETVAERSGRALFLNPLAAGLYLDGRLSETHKDSLRIRYFPGRVDEVRCIASEIKRIIHDDKLDISKDLGRIRIIFPELNEYSSLISEIFREYGIPFSLTRGLTLLSHPLSNIFLLIFKLPLNRFKRGDVFRLFSSGLIRKTALSDPYHKDEHTLKSLGENLIAGDDIHGVQKLLIKYAEDPLSDFMDIEFIDRIAQRCGLNNLGDDISGQDKGLFIVRDFYNGKLANTVESVDRDNIRREYYRFIIHYFLLADNLKSFKSLIDQDNPYNMANIFSGLLKDLGIPGNIINIPQFAETSSAFGDARMTGRDIKAYSLLKDIISASASELILDNDLFSARSGRDLLSGFYRIFRNRLDDSYLLDEQDPNVIRVSQWLEVRGRSFDYIFAGGLTDKSFPLKQETSFICPEPSRYFFRTPDNIDMSRYLFSHILRNYRKGLYLSCPVSADGREVRPSNVFTDIESLLTADSSPAYQEDTVKKLFKWDDSPYLSSENDMLNASFTKGMPDNRTEETVFPLKEIILKNISRLEGILRGLRAMGSRWALNGLFEYDGLVKMAAGFEEFLKSKRDIFSASQLDTLANCPMRYLFERVYGLKTMEMTGPEASPMEIGEHLHGVLSAFFRRLADQGRNVADMGIKQAFSQAREAADDYFRSIPFLESIEFFEHQKNEFLAGLDINLTDGLEAPVSREGAFAMLLRFEKANFMDRIPEGIEYEFGFNGLPYPHLGKVRLRGVIDRFDRDKNEKGLFHIYDYKTGTVPSSLLIKKGLSFQLPVYIKALKKCLKVEKFIASLYSLKRDSFLNKGPLGQYLFDHVAGDTTGLDITGVVILDRCADKLMELLEQGRFHHSADMIKCDYCDFRYACHRNERRMAHIVASRDDHGIYSGDKNLEIWKDADSFMREWQKIQESMEKAFSLKTVSGRKNHYESVLAFGHMLSEKDYTQTFNSEYIDELLRDIEAFKKRYLSNLPN